MTTISKFVTAAFVLAALPGAALAQSNLDDWDPGLSNGYYDFSQVPTGTLQTGGGCGNGLCETIVPVDRGGIAGQGNIGGLYSRDNCFLVSAEYDDDGHIIPATMVRACN